MFADAVRGIVGNAESISDPFIEAGVQMTIDIIRVERLDNALRLDVFKDFVPVTEYERVTFNLVTFAVAYHPASLGYLLHHPSVARLENHGDVILLAVLQAHFVAKGFDAAHHVEVGKVQHIF